MNIETALQAIQDFRAQVDQWGVTSEGLLAVAGLAVVMFIFSLREVLTWFMKIQGLRDDVRVLRAEIAELKAIMRERPLIIEEEVEAEAPANELKKKDPEKPAKAFRLDH